MRDFFINSLEKLINVLVVLMAAGFLIMAVVVMFDGRNGGFFAGIGVLIGGAIYVTLTAGMLYLFLGIYQNTKRTADAVEELKNK